MHTLEPIAPEGLPPASEKGTAAPSRLAGLLVAVLLLVLTAVAYGPVYLSDFQFLNADDDQYVTENPHVRTGISAANTVWALTAYHAANWHPLTWLSLQLDAQLFGLNPRAFHAVNVVLHALNAMLLFVVLRRLTRTAHRSRIRENSGSPSAEFSRIRLREVAGAPSGPTSLTRQRGMEPFWACVAVAAFFAVHPLHVESVAWIAERKDVLCGLFFLLTLWAYALYAERPSKGRYTLVLLLFALGLLAKPMLVTLPCLLLLLDYWPLERWTTNSPRQLIIEKLPLLALSGLVCVMTVGAQASLIQSTADVPFGDRLANAVVSYAEYLRATFWPTGLAFFYPLNREELVGWRVAGCALLLAAITILALLQRRRRPYLLVGWLWYLGMLVPVIGLVQLAVQARADRYTYLPQIGVLMLLAWGIADMLGRPRWRPVLASVGVGLLTACVAVTWVQTSYWHDSIALWQRTLAVTGNNGGAHLGLAAALEKQGANETAEEHYRRAVELLDNAAAHAALGTFLLNQGRLEESRQHLTRAAELMPRAWRNRFNLGLVLLRLGRPVDAREQLAEVVHLVPELGMGHYQLGMVLAQLGALEQAQTELMEAVLKAPRRAEVRYQLGNVLMRQGDFDQAREQFAIALENDPTHAQSLARQGIILTQMGRFGDAVTALQAAVQLEPGLSVRHSDLALALADAGQPAEAAREYKEATRLDAGWVEAARRLAWDMLRRRNLRPGETFLALYLARKAYGGASQPTAELLDTLAAAYAEMGRYDEAVMTARKALTLAESAMNTEQVRQIQKRLARYERREPMARE